MKKSSSLRIDAPISENIRSKLSLASFDQNGYVYRPDTDDWLGWRLGTALFSSDYENIQVHVIEPNGFAPITDNSAD